MNPRSKRGLFVLVLLPFLLAALALALSQEDSRRDAWQRPDEVMDAIGVHPGSRVADVGCGDGYFVLHLSRRVGAEGTVYGVDIDDRALGKLRRHVEQAGLTNVQVIRGREDDPLLPAAALDAVLMVNAYHEMRQYDAILRAILAALKPGGRLAIIDAPGNAGSSRDSHFRNHTLSESLAREDAERNGFRFLRREKEFDRGGWYRSRGRWFFLVFERPAQ